MRSLRHVSSGLSASSWYCCASVSRDAILCSAVAMQTASKSAADVRTTSKISCIIFQLHFFWGQQRTWVSFCHLDVYILYPGLISASYCRHHGLRKRMRLLKGTVPSFKLHSRVHHGHRVQVGPESVERRLAATEHAPDLKSVV